MKRQSGFSKIFAFTFARQTRSKGYIAGTIAAALICFLAPLLIMAAVEFFWRHVVPGGYRRHRNFKCENNSDGG